MNRATDTSVNTAGASAGGTGARTAPKADPRADPRIEPRADPSVDPGATPASASARGRRGPDEIEQDIHTIRSRMDAVLDEIEFRLSPGQVSGGAIEVVRDVIEGNPSRVARAIRSNPWPLAVIAAGAAWLAWNISRTPEVAKTAPGSPAGFVSDQNLRSLLAGLVTACHQGAVHFRQADLILDDPSLTPRLTQVAAQFDRSAAALEDELRRRGGAIGADEPVHPVWHDLHSELGGARSRGAVLSGLERGVDGTLALFRDALHEDLPEDLRVVIGAHFHEIETVRHRVGALREAVA
jgi:Protein of unknown function (DUF3618).